MRATVLSLLLLLIVAFTLAIELNLQNVTAREASPDQGALVAMAFGDSQRMLAQHFYAKADAYFHSGYYPSVFDRQPEGEALHMEASVAKGSELSHATEHEHEHAEHGHKAEHGKPRHQEEHAEHDHAQENKGADHADHANHESHDEHADSAEGNFLGAPRDWIDRFGRNFFPTQHRHLGETPAEAEAHTHDGKPCKIKHDTAGAEREMLPWFRLAARLDPSRPETYVVAAYWLSSHLGKINEAEQFLREGLRANPRHAEMLFELGRIAHDHRKDISRARNLWDLALASWHQQQAAAPEPNYLLLAQILGNLARLEEKEKQYAKALEHLQALKTVSPSKDAIQRWIDEVTVAAKTP